MDFFEAQDTARRKTWQLVALFALALICLLVLTNLVVGGAYFLFFSDMRVTSTTLYDGVRAGLALVPPETWLIISASVLGVVAAACLYKRVALNAGGRAVAESVGGIPVSPDTTDFAERRLLNVVEEMAIASGISVPPVYVLNEPGINAFAAGFTPDDAVIGITRGALEFLNREELQGVMGHEFSHILNGDTRINLRLIALLFGILFIGIVGQMLLRGSTRGISVGGRGRDTGGAGMGFILFGATLAVIGYTGTFFGNLIKAAVSRQREFLADAAAVQFTRNPQGISRALQKIGTGGSRLGNSDVSEASHMFFGQAQSMLFSRMMATHPPLEVRIKAIDPSWHGSFPEQLERLTRNMPEGLAALSDIQGVPVDVESLPEQVGRPDAVSVRTADAIVDTTDKRCLDAAHDPYAARLLVYALLTTDLDASKAVLGRPLERGGRERPGLSLQDLALLALLWGRVRVTDNLHRLALLEMAVPALKRGSDEQIAELLQRVHGLILADTRVELFEWVLHKLLRKELEPHIRTPRKPKVRYRRIERLRDQSVLLIACMSQVGHDEDADRRGAFADALDQLGAGTADWPLADDTRIDFAQLDAALGKLRDLAPLQKPKLLKACASAVLYDGVINPAEAALLQGLSAALDCPLPPSVVAKAPDA
ncbi:MAG: M48 family metallopeptidase [Pseudomonadota bacterium]